MFSIYKLFNSIVKGNKLLILLTFIFIFISSAISALSIKYTQKIVDFFVDTEVVVKDIYPLLLVLLLIKVLQIIFQYSQSFADTILSHRISIRITSFLVNTVNFITLTHIETPEYRNKLGYITNGINVFGKFIPNILSSINQIVLIVVYSIIIIKSTGFIMLALIITTTVPIFIGEYLRVKRNERYMVETMQLQREEGNIVNYMFQPEAQKEIFIFSSKFYFSNRWNQISKSIYDKMIRFQIKETLLKIVMNIVTPVRYILTQLILISGVVNNTLTVGEYVSIGLTISLIEGSLLSIIMNYGILKQALIVKHELDIFLGKYGRNVDNDEKLKLQSLENVQLNNLNFSYPNTTSVLNNVNVKVNLGDVLVILGENGSGKSTLGKIIAGLHNISENQLYYNGIDINQYDRFSVYKQVSIVSQDFIKYPFNTIENISFKTEGSTNDISMILNKYPQLLPNSLLDKMDIPLGNEYEGSVQLSGGQWQRIAIARSLYKDSSLLILDEATSALDPEAEYNTIRKIIENRRDKMTIIITHQINFAKLASNVILMREGKIIDSGSHRDLLLNNSHYQTMWSEKEEIVEEMLV